MKRFKFRLEKILRYKNQVEERKKQILSERNNELKFEKANLDRLVDRNNSYRNRYSSLFAGRLSIQMLVLSHRHLDKLFRDISRQKGEVKKSQEKVDKAKQNLQDAMRDKKKYEKLKERRKSDYEYEAGREEQKELDQIASRPAANIPFTDTRP